MLAEMLQYQYPTVAGFSQAKASRNLRMRRRRERRLPLAENRLWFVRLRGSQVSAAASVRRIGRQSIRTSADGSTLSARIVGRGFGGRWGLERNGWELRGHAPHLLARRGGSGTGSRHALSNGRQPSAPHHQLHFAVVVWVSGQRFPSGHGLSWE
jgi:hypothetical protein